MSPVRAAFLASTAFVLSACAALSLNDVPGRSAATYAACLAQQQQLKAGGGASAEDTIARAMATLLEGLANGSALTRDQFGASLVLTEATGPSGFTPPGNPVAATAPPGTVTPNLLRAREDSAFNEILDCYLGPVDKIDYEGRLLRGHIALAVIAAYTADVVKDAPTTQRAADAQRALNLLTDAELGLETGSPAMMGQRGLRPKSGTTAPPPIGNIHDRYVANVSRVQAILTAAAFADDVYAQDIWSYVGGLVADIGTKLDINPWSVARSVANGAVKTLQRMVVYQNYEAAYFASAHDTLISLHPGGIGNPGETDLVAITQRYAADFAANGVPDWLAWDDYVAAACQKLSVYAGATKMSCIPAGKQLYEALPPHLQSAYADPSMTAATK